MVEVEGKFSRRKFRSSESVNDGKIGGFADKLNKMTPRHINTNTAAVFLFFAIFLAF
ncbi:hypothetical protein GCA01S_030_00210 [Parageobacillus caldoxylosilyticus NBRC 107762]|jgi:hypothetical protein|uniref:Uncharacterized protein n=1 Tax=Parageobacillus caldoxylosilyticus NBRC 107762 TaxID=1220594 RepID=A0A023DFA1_9BACL|nr:hypothetical protein [Parageobacillus caldoxylosilyticus]BDG43626.1 hypothetical protein PcaKH35_19710 [Parageobacillus caldoxylosilyticus]GAJ39940.1 hypothetical protein GCA01S_030_00210 [Parageobacillus caldoxylosilyticus NBRC 107762]